MYRSVPYLKAWLRAVALAAVFGGQTACVQPVPVITTTSSASLSSLSPSVRTPARPLSDEAPRVVVRDYWGAPRSSVVAWNDDESYQGLRSAVRRDGTIAFDHTVYFSAYALPNLSVFRQANWYAFSDAETSAKELPFRGISADRFNCAGKQGCSPYLTFQALIPDALLRSSHDSLVVKVVSRNGFETMIALRGDLISSFLATLDSVSAARKAR